MTKIDVHGRHGHLWTIATFDEPPPLIPTQHHMLDEFSMGDHPVMSWMSSSTASEQSVGLSPVIMDCDRNGRRIKSHRLKNSLRTGCSRAANSQFRHIIELSPPAFGAALETVSPWAGPGESVLDLKVTSGRRGGK
jgi:hypothetical protein